mmetsp:Transcript_9750/g.21720  ORF Transcript_9750/g.21720 Transcript_9750/m.21720 type:complete len:111 (+) Transcript_9750:1258-1590(+)
MDPVSVFSTEYSMTLQNYLKRQDLLCRIFCTIIVTLQSGKFYTKIFDTHLITPTNLVGGPSESEKLDNSSSGLKNGASDCTADEMSPLESLCNTHIAISFAVQLNKDFQS